MGVWGIGVWGYWGVPVPPSHRHNPSSRAVGCNPPGNEIRLTLPDTVRTKQKTLCICVTKKQSVFSAYSNAHRTCFDQTIHSQQNAEFHR